ncbi:hypothetical protein B5M09_009912 [Aphanomyces astaci]|uniref:Uncharacterized protein n=1 Tax=Aphanomyces astaci TaxID=112090 RepID=A0A3R7WDM3_APHAT|nr:hypothetical protein B5M09_009912 [Aphanomyces astaci]
MSSGILATFLRARGLPLLGLAAAAIYYYDKSSDVIAFMQVYGWFVVLGIVGLLYLDHQLAIQLTHWDRQQSLDAANGRQSMRNDHDQSKAGGSSTQEESKQAVETFHHH